MVIPAIFYLIISLIMGIFFIIVGCLAVNQYIRNREGTLISIIFPFILGIIGIMGAIYGFISFLLVIAFVIFIIFSGYSKYISYKHPEIKKNREEYLEKLEKHREMYKKTSFYKFMRVSRYIMLACIIFLTVFILIVVLFNITF
jgi:hypothetical protein